MAGAFPLIEIVRPTGATTDLPPEIVPPEIAANYLVN